MHIVSWNVNGIRSVLRKGALEAMLARPEVDILCLQEIRCDDKVAEQLLQQHVSKRFPWSVWSCSQVKKGYAGTAIYSRREPLDMKTIDLSGNTEGRVTLAHFPEFTLINVYTPNAGAERYEFRTEQWDHDFRQLVLQEGQKNNVIVCGDFNVAHHDIDICQVTYGPLESESNERVSGLTVTERNNFRDLVDTCGLVDSFRFCNPYAQKFSWWSNFRPKRNDRIQGGWRIDYILVSRNMVAAIQEADIDIDTMGSDHAPIWLKIFDRV